MRARAFVIAASATALCGLAGCGDGSLDGLLDPGAPSMSITDGRDDGFDHIFFLPPIEKGDFVRTANFNPWLDLRIEICALDAVDPLTDPSATAASSCQAGRPLIAWFERDAASDGSSFIALNTEVDGAPAPDSSYSVGWKTTSDLAGEAFRLHVLVRDEVVAWADIILGSSSSQVQNMGDNYGDVAGRNIPIKLVAEMGVGCSGLDCFAVFVTCEGGTFRSDHAGAVLPPGFAAECGTPEEPDGWWFYQERIVLPPGQRCLPTEWEQFDPCYVWELIREDGTRYDDEFVPGALPVVTYCIEGDGIPWTPVLTGFRSGFPYDDFDEMSLTPEASDPFPITCPYDGPQPIGPLGIAGSVLRRVAALAGVRPRSLHAGDTSTSSKTSKFSRFSRVLATMFDGDGPISGGAQTGLSGSTLPEPLIVRVTSISHHEGDEWAYEQGNPEAGAPLEGIPVSFTVTSGGGTLSDGTNSGTSLVVYTDANGYALVHWTLGPADGPQTVVASGTEMSHTFTADAVQIFADFLPPLAASEGSWTPLYETFAPRFLVCPGAGPSTVACTATKVAEIPTTAIKLVEKDGRRFYQAGWKARDSSAPAEAYYHVQVVLPGDHVAGSSVPIYISGGGKDQLLGGVYQAKPTSNIEIKVRLTRAQP